MRGLARKIPDRLPRAIGREPRQGIGTIVDVADDGISVRMEDGPTLRARRAVSCLVAPQPGDAVLLSLAGDRRWVLAVLEREGADVTIRLARGRLSLAAQDGIDLASARTVTVASAEVDVTAARGKITFGRLAYLGDLVHAEVARIRQVAQVLDSTVERLTQKAKRAYRFVTELDVLKAGQVDVQAKSTLRLHAENSLMTAKELVKLDGEQIHLG